MKLETLTQVNAERAARRPVIVITDTANGEQRLVKAKDIATDPLSAELSKQLRMGKSGMVESGGKKLFLNVHAPTARLVIVGAVHISQALAPLARSLDYDVTVVDPRTAFASPERFPDVPLIAEWPDVALPRGSRPLPAVARRDRRLAGRAGRCRRGGAAHPVPCAALRGRHEAVIVGWAKLPGRANGLCEGPRNFAHAVTVARSARVGNAPMRRPI